MASEVNDVIEDYMRSHKSPIELQKEVEDIYGADAEEIMSIDEARKSIAEGKGTSISGKEELDSLLASL